jgi:hypothetical protein
VSERLGQTGENCLVLSDVVCRNTAESGNFRNHQTGFRIDYDRT